MKKKITTTTPQNAFTLIEMLVTISIIALLAALLAPSLAQARSSARTMTCASNLKQLALLHFDQAWETNAFARSAYDLTKDRWPLVSSDPFTINNDLDKPGTPPDGTGNFAIKLNKQENASPKQPPHWKLPCPEAIPTNEMSFGLNYRFRGINPDRINPQDIIFAGSPYRLLVRGRDLLPARHKNRVNFLYGDTHISADPQESLKEEDAYRQTWRPEPIPADYPDQ